MKRNFELMSYKRELSLLIEKIEKTFHLQTAIFDTKGTLITCSNKYTMYKGQQVHLPSIQEVLEKKHLVVHNPGQMPSCKGCRFNDHCPSKIELLTPIYYQNTSIGVITLTSFSDNGHLEIKNNLNTYIKFIHYLSNTIVNFLFHNTKSFTTPISEHYPHLDDFTSANPNMQKIIAQAKRIAPSNANILLTGETGTGKSLLSKAIHYEGKGCHAPFITINCGAIPDTLLESELFGYEEGAFTGAKKGGKIGKIELANNGTLFLDEIGEMPLLLQVKLLHFIQNREIERIGSHKTIPLNVRIISATHQNLEKLIQEKKFREDLYYRINVFPMHLPSLKQRKEDIPFIAENFINTYHSEHHLGFKSMSDEYLDALINYDWPGNIRELENILEYGIQLSVNNILDVNDLPPKLQNFIPHHSKFSKKNYDSIKGYDNDQMTTDFAPKTLKAKEKEYLLLLIKNYGNDSSAKKKVADEMNISLRTLYRKIQ